MSEVERLIEKLGLETLEHEGGWFQRIYTGPDNGAGRPVCTTVYCLFTGDEFSAMHRLDVDEQFFYMAGDPFETFKIDPNGRGEWRTLSAAESETGLPHLAFEAGSWFGGRPTEGGSYGWSLITAVVSPGFNWSSFTLGGRNELLSLYPKYEDAIRLLTR